MKKKVLSLLLVAAMGISMLVGCGGGNDADANKGDANKDTEVTYDYTGVEIKVWVADAVVDFTNQQIEAWKTANPEMKDIVVTVEAVGEGDAANNMTTDVTAGADIYTFAQDQMSRLVTAEALSPIGGDYAKAIAENNDAGAAAAAKLGDKTYAFPITSDNGYFMYYDKSIVTDVTTLDAVLAACEKAGKGFYFDVDSAWYNAAFFFADGCVAEYDVAADGTVAKANVTYDKGINAVKAMIKMCSSKAFVDGSSVGEAANAAVVVSGTWDKESAVALFGDNYACAKLPTAEIGGKQVQLGGFGGFKLVGMKPQTDAAKQNACLSLANYLTSEEVQLARFNAVGWGPSNKNAQASDAVKADPALAALAEQLGYTIPQGQYPNSYWSDIEAFCGDIKSGAMASYTDDQIQKALDDLNAKLLAAHN